MIQVFELHLQTQQMTRPTLFIVTNIIIIVTAGIVCFKNFRNLRKSLSWLFFPDIIAIWSKKRWTKDFENTFRFEVFILLTAVLIGINYLIFKYIL